MSQSNEYLLRMRQQTYGSSGQQSIPQSQPPINNTNNYTQLQPQPQQERYNPPEIEDPNSCGNLICEKWNLILLFSTLLSISILGGLLIAFK